MKKVTVLCLEQDRESALEYLRELGLLHLEPIQAPESASVDEARREIEYIRRALEILPHKPQQPPSGQTPHQVVNALWEIIHQRREFDEEREGLNHEVMRMEAFGSFDPDAVRALAEKGLHVGLFEGAPGHEPAAPEGTVLQVLRRGKQAVSFALIGRDPIATPPDAHAVRLPAVSLDAMKRRMADIDGRLQELDAQTVAFGGDYPYVAAFTAAAEDRLKMSEAHAGMGLGADKRIAYLRGYGPAAHTGCLREAAAQSGWGLMIEEPDENDRVPTLIRNARWVKPIKAVFDFIGIVPGYREVDISAVFLVFFSLFFAMLVGDAGYGALFLGGTIWARRKFPAAPGYVFGLLLLTSVSTIGWGIITGTYFGIAHLPAPLEQLKIGWLTDPKQGTNHLMGLCFLIGAIQLSVAHVWNAWINRRSAAALAQAGWLCTTWAMYFAARTMVLGFPFPDVMLWALVLGIVLIVVFMTPLRKMKTEWFNHVMLPLNLIGNFVDVVSYIRLFAVGTATLAVAQAFNGMAIGDGIRGPGHALLAALILLVGHTLNIVLACMGVIVHGVRLNTLEFSGHLGMQWTGVRYAPFARAPQSAADAQHSILARPGDAPAAGKAH